jgi:hypothetical protein
MYAGMPQNPSGPWPMAYDGDRRGRRQGELFDPAKPRQQQQQQQPKRQQGLLVFSTERVVIRCGSLKCWVIACYRDVYCSDSLMEACVQ